jgi:predicted DNA-binding protein
MRKSSRNEPSVFKQLKLPKSIKERLEIAADSKYMSANSFIIVAIEKYLNELENS